ncbi:MAG: hypothetical protein A2508_03680 [Candidatus Lambdaproteobacteria bacterium RIFOXYD12_FULL_49_8]|uniref:Uncharacterized protein n=1 Tax=Candidatus Lambdaproteobacteria bacterium RIFOXYD2_FULL_50_16 TaxID=1817772 RepID=A0A1F6GD31_9PROT|nr:MAG: hypothetical protein A2527_11885 [Candidatus Lambdaproteobacteria bacterium RIFOXYD2_FULL_50_16]OGG96274.1 MAG: hypothetical protein A2508_03680 [Candidatus Lambdaproteobacteria bacterium RIFOXYD12_FULL_49_8]
MKGFITWLKEDHPEIWASVLRAVDLGLILVDEKNEALSATARLELTYPDLQEVLNLLAHDHARKTARSQSHDFWKELLHE